MSPHKPGTDRRHISRFDLAFLASSSTTVDNIILLLTADSIPIDHSSSMAILVCKSAMAYNGASDNLRSIFDLPVGIIKL